MVGISLFVYRKTNCICNLQRKAIQCLQRQLYEGGKKFVIILENFVNMLLLKRDKDITMHLKVEVLFLSSSTKINIGPLMPEKRTIH